MRADFKKRVILLQMPSKHRYYYVFMSQMPLLELVNM